MKRTSTLLPRAVAAALALIPVLGWTVTEAVTANRMFEGGLSIDIDLDRALSLDGKAATAVEQQRPAGGSQDVVFTDELPKTTSLLVVSEGTVKAVEQ